MPTLCTGSIAPDNQSVDSMLNAPSYEQVDIWMQYVLWMCCQDCIRFSPRCLVATRSKPKHGPCCCECDCYVFIKGTTLAISVHKHTLTHNRTHLAINLNGQELSKRLHTAAKRKRIKSYFYSFFYGMELAFIFKFISAHATHSNCERTANIYKCKLNENARAQPSVKVTYGALYLNRIAGCTCVP